MAKKPKKLPPPFACPACKRTGSYEQPKMNCYYCPHCGTLHGMIYLPEGVTIYLPNYGR